MEPVSKKRNKGRKATEWVGVDLKRFLLHGRIAMKKTYLTLPSSEPPSERDL